MGNRTSRFVRRNWGYLLLAGAVVLLFGYDVGPLVLSAAFVLVFIWLLFRVPTWCGATTRNGQPCRKNSYGLLGGCEYRQHKWQRVHALTRLGTLRDAFRGWFTGSQQQVATCALFVTTFGTVAALFK